MSEPTVRITRYEVNAYPDLDSVNADMFRITVENRGEDRWAVCWKGRCIGKRGQWSWESRPSSRPDRWKNAYRHDLATAIKLAKKAAPNLRTNGVNPAECWAWEQQQGEVA